MNTEIKNELVEMAQKLARYESTHENKDGIEACLNFCRSFFTDEDIFKITNIKNNEIESIIVTPKRYGPNNIEVLLLGHIDTVPGSKEQFKGNIKENWLYGRGTLDMKAFVATSITLFISFVKENPNAKLGLLIVSDEELGGKYGAKYIANSEIIKPTVVLVPDDGEDIGQIVSENKSIIHIDVFANGVEAHACRPWDGKNAIEMLFSFINNISPYFKESRTTKNFKWVNTMNIGKISGGLATNEVPSSAKMSIDIRYTKNTNRQEIIDLLDHSLIDGLHYSISDEMVGSSIDNEKNEVYKLYEYSIINTLNKKPQYIKSGGGTDGDHFAKKGSLIIKHQGTGFDCQSENERVYLPSLQQLVDIQSDFLNKYFKK